VLEEEEVSVDFIYESLMPSFDLPGVALSDLIVNTSGGESQSVPTDQAGSYGQPDVEGDLQILASLGLSQKVDIHRQVNKEPIRDISVHYFYILDMGCRFLDAVSVGRRS